MTTPDHDTIRGRLSWVSTGGGNFDNIARHLIAVDVPALLDENTRLRNALNTAAEKVREAAEQWLYDGDRDCPLPGYNEVQDLADTIERFPLVVPVSARSGVES
jgi:hypothetical protein